MYANIRYRTKIAVDIEYSYIFMDAFLISN